MPGSWNTRLTKLVLEAEERLIIKMNQTEHFDSCDTIKNTFYYVEPEYLKIFLIASVTPFFACITFWLAFRRLLHSSANIWLLWDLVHKNKSHNLAHCSLASTRCYLKFQWNGKYVFNIILRERDQPFLSLWHGDISLIRGPFTSFF